METLRYVLLVNGLLALVSVAFYALLRRETFFDANRLALWLGLIGAIVLPLVELPDWRPQPVRAVMQHTAQVIAPSVLPHTPTAPPEVTITFPNGKTYRAFPNRPVENSFVWSWPTILVVVYLMGVLILLIRFGFQLSSLQRLIRRSDHEQYDDFTLVKSSQIRSPFSFFSWVVLNPDLHRPDELEQILRHERVHVRSWHSLDMIGAELACIVFWFNPAAYLFRQLLRQTLEFSADRAVLAEGVDAKAYQYHLINVSLSAGPSAITNHFSGPTLRQRIGMMNRQRSGFSAGAKYIVLGFCVFSVAMACQNKSVTIHKYIQATDNEFFSIITPQTSNQDLDTLRQELKHRNIDFSLKGLSRLANGQISQMTVNLQVPKPGHPIDVIVGSTLRKSPIPTLGLQCTDTGCQLNFVDETFPGKLVEIARKESYSLTFDRESSMVNAVHDANSKYGLYKVFLRNDFFECNYFGLPSTGIRMTSDFHLDLYPEYQNAIIFLDGKEINRNELRAFHPIDLKKVVVFNGNAAKIRLGDTRAKNGLILLFRLPNMDIRDKYAATPLLERVYPQLFKKH